MAKRISWVAFILAVVVLLGLLVQGVRVHRLYGEWGLLAPEAPARIDALQRQYDRGDEAAATDVPDSYGPRGETEGGGLILAPTSRRPQPVVVFVQESDGRLWAYGLVGGP